MNTQHKAIVKPKFSLFYPNPKVYYTILLPFVQFFYPSAIRHVLKNHSQLIAQFLQFMEDFVISIKLIFHVKYRYCLRNWPLIYCILVDL